MGEQWDLLKMSLKPLILCLNYSNKMVQAGGLKVKEVGDCTGQGHCTSVPVIVFCKVLLNVIILSERPSFLVSPLCIAHQ